MKLESIRDSHAVIVGLLSGCISHLITTHLRETSRGDYLRIAENPNVPNWYVALMDFSWFSRQATYLYLAVGIIWLAFAWSRLSRILSREFRLLILWSGSLGLAIGVLRLMLWK